jgi:hypothetical protein
MGENLELWPDLARRKPRETWAHLRSMDRDEQIAAMRRWFTENYEDPANQTPYESAEGGYIWVYGGPYDALEELSSEFGDDVAEDVIEELAEKLSDIMPDWARIADYDDYDDDLWDSISANQNAFATFREAIAGAEQLLAAVATPLSDRLYPLLFANAITALEVYLSDTFINKVMSDPTLLRRFVETTPEFRKRKFTLDQVFQQAEAVSGIARDHLLRQLWHPLPQIESMYRATLGIVLGDSIQDVARAISIRHDIVHRNGRTRDGQVVAIGEAEVAAVVASVQRLVQTVEEQFNEKYPTPPPWGDGEPPF